ncbi:hypothetical protein, partial [Brucella intermedia]|uniref:hypothetical protein n=1 Tax=Brucella intermedia TaxID=94625 RepID=UPI00224B1247
HPTDFIRQFPLTGLNPGSRSVTWRQPASAKCVVILPASPGRRFRKMMSDKQLQGGFKSGAKRFFAGNCGQRRNQEHFRRYGT